MFVFPFGHNIFFEKKQKTRKKQKNSLQVIKAHNYTSAYIYSSYLVFKNMSETESDYEQDYDSDSTPEVSVPRRHHKSGKSGQHLREEPTSLT